MTSIGIGVVDTSHDVRAHATDVPDQVQPEPQLLQRATADSWSWRSCVPTEIGSNGTVSPGSASRRP